MAGLVAVLVAGGCKVRERTEAAVASDIRVEAESRRDSVRVAYSDRAVFRADTAVLREVEREYGAPIRTPDGDYFVPLVREITRGTETGTKETWQTREDILSGGFEEGTFSRESDFSAEEHTTHATEDRSGWYLTLVALGALVIGGVFVERWLSKRG
ncbi:MAG: hypothetical protein MR609_06950 [Bacteroidales bacterium]|nr:hypothetical protein [Bacteroidales bacterium]